ncbi:MAG: hypothetical protein AAF806_09835, partial [Bacteroidota bacterium]
EVTVSFNEGNLISLDGVKADAFTDEELSFNIVNLLENYEFDWSFENSTSDDWKYLGWGEDWDGYNVTMSEDIAYDGSRSMLVEYDANDGMIIGLKDADGNNITFPAEAGQAYELGVWVNVQDLGNNDPAGFTPDLRIYWGPDTNWGIGPNPAFTDDFIVGEWVYSSIFFEFTETGEDKFFMFRGFNAANEQPLKFYMDNITLAEVTLRP